MSWFWGAQLQVLNTLKAQNSLLWCSHFRKKATHELYHANKVVKSCAKSCCLVFKAKRKSEHITPLLISLYWLPVKYRIDFTILLFIFKSLHNQAPQGLSEPLHLISQSRSLRSRNSELHVPRASLKNREDHVFTVIRPKLLNSLPSKLCQI